MGTLGADRYLHPFGMILPANGEGQPRQYLFVGRTDGAHAQEAVFRNGGNDEADAVHMGIDHNGLQGRILPLDRADHIAEGIDLHAVAVGLDIAIEFFCDLLLKTGRGGGQAKILQDGIHCVCHGAMNSFI